VIGVIPGGGGGTETGRLPGAGARLGKTAAAAGTAGGGVTGRGASGGGIIGSGATGGVVSGRGMAGPLPVAAGSGRLRRPKRLVSPVGTACNGAGSAARRALRRPTPTGAERSAIVLISSAQAASQDRTAPMA